MTGREKMYKLKEFFTDDKLLEEVIIGMSEDEAKETAEFIARMYDIEL